MYNESEDVEAVLAASTGDQIIGEALLVARRVCNSLNEAWAGHDLAPDFQVALQTGADDEPVLVFTITLALRDDFPTESWPADEVAEMKAEVRRRLQGAELNGISWYVTVAAGQPS